MRDFEPSPAFRLANKMVTPLVRWGVPMGVKRAPMALLTVPGRNTGTLRTTPVALASTDDGWVLIAVYGVSDWSRNLEVAGGGTLTIRGREVRVNAQRLGPLEAGPVLRDAILDAPSMIRRMTAPYFSTDVSSSVEQWQRESMHHPVFVLTPVPD